MCFPLFSQSPKLHTNNMPNISKSVTISQVASYDAYNLVRAEIAYTSGYIRND